MGWTLYMVLIFEQPDTEITVLAGKSGGGCLQGQSVEYIFIVVTICESGFGVGTVLIELGEDYGSS